MVPDAQIVPTSIDDILHDLGELGPCWVVDGAWGPHGGSIRRTFVVESPEEAPRVAWLGWLDAEDAHQLSRILGARRADGALGTGPGWTLLWTCDGGPLQVIDKQGLLLRAHRGLAEIRGIGTVRPARVEAWADSDWVRRGVRLVDLLGDELVLAVHHGWEAVDPTYDWLDLDCDAGWASAVASAIGRALGVAVHVSWDDPPWSRGADLRI